MAIQISLTDGETIVNQLSESAFNLGLFLYRKSWAYVRLFAEISIHDI